MTKLLLLALPGGALLYAAAFMLRCRHAHEVLRLTDEAGAQLYCPDCGRVRRHPWAGEPVRYRRTQEGGQLAAQPTGIERAVEEAAVEAREIADALYLMERRQRHEEIGLRVVSRFGRCNDTASR